jgi:hypothetical protein
VKHRPDYALYPMLLFEVLATDNGNPSLTGSALVNISIIDVNDMVPNFEQDYYNLDVPCDEPVGTTIVTVSATDDGKRIYVFAMSVTQNINRCHLLANALDNL